MKNLHLSIKDYIATISFNLENEKINKLSFKVIEEFNTLLDEIHTNKTLKALIVTSLKDDMFIAGADLKEIKAFNTKNEVYNALIKAHQVFNKLEALKIPTIAYINGACLGGGLELALACKYRVASTNVKTIFAFPEVKLGFFPGLAGCIRTPKVIGLINALDLILSSKRINAKQAYRLKLVDEIFSQGQKEFKLKSFITKVINNEVNIKRKKYYLDRYSFTRNIIYKKVLKNLEKKVNPDFKAPYKALEVIQKTYKIMALNDAIKLEAKEFSNLALTKETKYLIDLFFTFEKLNKNYTKTTKSISNLTVLGSGVMATGIVYLFSQYLKDIRIKVRDLHQVTTILKDVSKIYDFFIKTKKLTPNDVDFKLNKISYTNKYEGLRSSSFIIEAILEDEKIKQETFQDLEKHISKDTIIASNTSSLSIEKLSSTIKNKKNFLGVHFFNPVHLMPLVEVIPNSHTSKETINKVFELLISCKKTPILVKDCAGFIVNRILLPYVNEAGFILESSSDIKEIDKTLKDFGMPMGAFSLADSVGLDIGYKVSKILNKAYGNRMPIASILEKLKDLKLLGKKSKEGFYLYSNKKIKVNPKIQLLINTKRLAISKEEIISRCMLIMINESARCLEEHIVDEAYIIDFAMITGTGFPAYKGGILAYANDIGIKEIIKKLQQYEETYGLRFKACDLLKKLAKSRKDFNTGEQLWK